MKSLLFFRDSLTSHHLMHGDELRAEAVLEWKMCIRDSIRGLIRETSLSPEHLIYPVFVHEGTVNQPIPSLPGCTRWSVKGLVEEAKRLMDLGIRTLDLFPAIPDKKKTYPDQRSILSIYFPS